MKENMRYTPIALAVMVALSHTHIAMAEETGTEVREKTLAPVQVIGNTPIEGLEVPVSQVPSNVQILKAQDIEQQGVIDLAELLNNNLGSVTVTNAPGNPYQNDISYRGFQATSILGSPVGLSVYFDGVRMNEAFGSNVNWDLIPMNSISSMSISPGSNPLFGLNTLGGALVVNTKNGKDNAGSSLTGLAGSFGRRAIRFENGWEDTDKDADYFISGNFDKQDGYRKYSNSDVQQLYGKARMRSIGPATNAELSFALVNNSLHGTQALPTAMYDNPRSAYTAPDSTNNLSGFLNLKLKRQLNDAEQIAGNVYYRHTRTRSSNSNLEYDDGCFTASGLDTTCKNDFIPGTGTAKNIYGWGTTNPLNFQRYTDNLNSSLIEAVSKQDTLGASAQWTNLGRLGEKDNAMTLGAIASHSSISFSQDTWLARMVDYQTIADRTNPRYYFGDIAASSGGFTGSGLIRNVNLSAKSTNFSVFMNDTLTVNEKLDVSASAAYNITVLSQTGQNSQFLNDDGGYSWRDAENLKYYYNPNYLGAYQYRSSSPYFNSNPLAAPSRNGYTTAAGPHTESLDGSHTYQRLNPAVGFNFKPDPEKMLNIFGGYSESMRAPTPIELSCADPARPCALPTGFNGDPDLKAVVAHTVELGARGTWGADTLWNVAAYDTKTSNDIQFQFSSASRGYFANVGDTERRGLEMGVATRLDKLFLAANYGVVDARFRSAFTTAGGVNVVSGYKMPGIANQSVKLRAAYDINPRLLLGTNIRMIGGQYAYGDEDNTHSKVANYTIANLDLHYRLNDNITVFGLVNNVFDKRYSTYGLIGTNVYNATEDDKFRTPAAGRAIWLGMTYHFGGKKPETKARVDND